MLTINLTEPVRLKVLAGLALLTALLWVNWRTEQVVLEDHPEVIPIMGKLKPLYQVRTREKKITLTFDISWGHVRPGPVLDQLKKYNVKATFFLSGPWAKYHPEIVRRIQAEGHDIQSHGHKHVDFSGLSREHVKENILAADAILTQLTGRKPSFIRPPNGDYNDIAIETARELGYTVVIWSVDSLDWKNIGVEQITDRVLKARSGDIVLLHASDTCQQTDQALPAIIEGLRAQGYQLVTLPELIRASSNINS